MCCDKLVDLRTACVRANAKCLLVDVYLSKHYRAGIGQTIATHCGQYRSSPGVVTVYAGATKLFPDLLANILRCVLAVLHGTGTGQSTNQGPNGGEPPVHRNDLTCKASGAVFASEL